MWLTTRIKDRALPCYSHLDTIAACTLDAKQSCLRIFTNYYIAPSTCLTSYTG